MDFLDITAPVTLTLISIEDGAIGFAGGDDARHDDALRVQISSGDTHVVKRLLPHEEAELLAYLKARAARRAGGAR